MSRLALLVLAGLLAPIPAIAQVAPTFQTLRSRIVERIGQVKQECGFAIYEPKREEQVFANITGHNRGPLSPEAVRRIFERIIDEARSIQRVRMVQDGDK